MNIRFSRALKVICAGLLLLVFLALWLLNQHDSGRQASTPSPRAPARDPLPSARSPFTGTSRKDDDPDEYNQRVAAWDQKIAFYGKVTDQKGNSIPGVKIVASATTQQILPGQDLGVSGEVATVTDGGGLFTIENLSGYSLNILLMEKDGYAHRSHLASQMTGGDGMVN